MSNSPSSTDHLSIRPETSNFGGRGGVGGLSMTTSGLLLLFANAKLKQQSYHSSVRVKWLSHYSLAQQILLVGEGDFFSFTLANAFGSTDNLITTSLDSCGLPFPSSPGLVIAGFTHTPERSCGLSKDDVSLSVHH
ncbi:hypothetical protein MUK42_00532 [Musa troglodytarum]|uniref:Uncharacterized protein n=1 Tax=Musa troglodytarum TaxID=320322 RepID=A0A9E7FD69_9LILI|nr:hypothetical protein MUK42_00532 [Musa troglodytarum]